MQNGQEAFQTFAESPAGTYNIILMDIQMPVMNGYEAARQIRSCENEDAKTIPILAMSANAFQEEDVYKRQGNYHISPSRMAFLHMSG